MFASMKRDLNGMTKKKLPATAMIMHSRHGIIQEFLRRCKNVMIQVVPLGNEKFQRWIEITEMVHALLVTEIQGVL